jgi:hypothetical protein
VTSGTIERNAILLPVVQLPVSVALLEVRLVVSCFHLKKRRRILAPN